MWNNALNESFDEAVAPDRISRPVEASTPDSTSNGNIATQLISTFGWQKQAMALQDKINSAVDTLNSLLGETPTKVGSLYKNVSFCYILNLLLFIPI